MTAPYEPMDPFLADLMKHMMSAIENPGIPIATEVFTLEVPPEMIDEIKRVPLEILL